MDWKNIDSIDCIPYSCNHHSDFSNNSLLTLYPLGTILRYSCPNGQQIRTRCILDTTSGFPEWDFDVKCSDKCPNEWIFDDSNRMCYSRISAANVSYYRAEWLCANENYALARLISYDMAKSLFANRNEQGTLSIWVSPDPNTESELLDPQRKALDIEDNPLCLYLTIFPNVSLTH